MNDDDPMSRTFDAVPGGFVRVFNHRHDPRESPDNLGCALDIVCVRSLDAGGGFELRNIYDAEEFVGVCVGLAQLSNFVRRDDVITTNGNRIPLNIMRRLAAIVYVIRARCKSGNTYDNSYRSGGIEVDEYSRFPSGPFVIVLNHEDGASIERVFK